MTLKEITKDLHHEAETTEFAKLLLSGKIDKHTYANYLYQLLLIYPVIELHNKQLGNLETLTGIERSAAICFDFEEIKDPSVTYTWLPATVAYHNYLQTLVNDDARKHMIKAHMYCRHMGDLYGGQIIKKQVSSISSGKFYNFTNADMLKTNIRAMLTDDLGDEARVAFTWAITMMKELSNV